MENTLIKIFISGIFLLLGRDFVFGSDSSAQQSFRITPEDTEVILGQDFVLRCQVNNQKGQAQWTRKGFALGFDRNITSKPRYQMIGDATQGVHDLSIKNASLIDDGKFECQVTPYPPDVSIRHNVTVTVLIPPSSIEMLDEAPRSNKTVKEGRSQTLTCVAKYAKPAPKILWFKGSEQIVSGNIKDEEMNSDTPKLKNMKSRITFTPTARDNGVEYSCRASHKALGVDEELSASVFLNVHYPPGDPEITGYEEGETLKAGENKSLICKCRSGNPPPHVFWYKNGKQIDTDFQKHKLYSINTYNFTVRSSDNGANYECHVHNVMTTQPKKSQITVKVNFPPSVIKITGPSEVRANDIISISCEARNSNPPADVTLLINSRHTSNVSTNVSPTSDGGSTTVANVTRYHVVETERDLQVDCYALAAGESRQNTTIIKVLRPPRSPHIFGYRRGEILRAGEEITLTCRSVGGNPVPDLKWFKLHEELPSIVSKDERTAVAKLVLSVDHRDNGAEYRCEASNSASTYPMTNSTTLTVMYPPSGLNVSMHPSQPRAGDMVTLTCTTAPAFPKANISWWKDGFKVSGGEYGLETDGLYLGIVTTFSVNITAAIEDNRKQYTCQAGNTISYELHDVLTLDVLYTPIIKKISGPREASEGEDILLTASAEGNPSNLKYIWKKDGDVVMVGRYFNVTKASKNVAGRYVLEVSNEIGTTSENLTIVVKYAPSISKTKGHLEVNEMSDGRLECHFDGVPAPKVKWSRKKYKMDKTSIYTEDKKSILTVKNVSAVDTGFFKCTVQSELGKNSESQIPLVVNQRPEADKSPQYQKAAADIGDTARLICRVTASPKPTFSWFIRNEHISSDIHPRYKMEPEELKDKLNTYESVLVIEGVERKDHGSFTCRARNVLGISSVEIILENTKTPDPPVELKVLNVSHDAVKLAWVPGFDGGHAQSFKIRYQLKGEQSYKEVQVYPQNSTQYWVDGLKLSSTYTFRVCPHSDKGAGPCSAIKVEATTLSDYPSDSKPPSRTGEGVTSLVIIIITLAGAAFIVLNIALITCFIKRSAKKRLTASSDKGSSKSTTIEMYAPSSYTGTVTGETLSSISEKSRESYAQEDSADDYEETNRMGPTATYLIGQVEPPPQYASRPPPHILPPPPSHNDLGVEGSHDVNMLRNQYNAALDRVPGYGTLGRRGPSSMGSATTHLGPSRYNTYIPPTAHVEQQQHHPVHPNYEGSLRRNAPKLHFPKDYIRNGSMSNVGTPTRDTTSSYGRNVAGSPALSSFAPDLTSGALGVESSPPGSMEQRGHLV